MPNSWTATRIEQRSGGGFPDVFLCIDGFPVLIELKSATKNRCAISPAQVAFIYKHSAKNGLAFVLASPPDRRKPVFFLIKGAEIMNFAHDPRIEDHGIRFEGYESLFSGLRSATLAHYSGLVASVAD